MATSAEMKIIGKEQIEGTDIEAYLYRCCDAVSDEMKDIIEKAYKGYHSINQGYFSGIDPREVVALIYAEAYFEAKQKLPRSFHICIQPYPLNEESNFILDVTDIDNWKFTYYDWDENDNEILVTKVLTQKGWV